jgi:2'-5' RNA ligase
MDVDKNAVFGIVAFPSLGEGDRQRIESIRAKHDPQAERIAAHFTLVFPTVLSRRVIDAQAARVAKAIEPIRFVLRRAAVVPETIGEGGHIFLMPEEGRDQITQLHDRLYEGALQSHVRKDVTFVPHITIAARPALALLHGIAGEINASGWNVVGFISEVTLVELAPTTIQTVAHFQLGPT